ncbi:MAG TPA: histone-like nucleoid-structuring protein Lsr2, partial [Polyangiaceae bacterium]
PTRRASRQVLEILVDSHERYPWRFSAQQATTRRHALPAGDYGVEVGGRIIAAVERKSLADLTSTLTTGKLRYLLAALDELPRAALVVEDRYSAVFKPSFVTPGVLAEGLAEAQVRFPAVPIVFCETRPLAQEWTYRFLGAAVVHQLDDEPARERTEALPSAGPLAPAAPTPAEVRAWALANGYEVSLKGRVPASILEAFNRAHANAE